MRYLKVPILLALLVLLGVRGQDARSDVEEKHYYVRIGDKAPVFEARDEQGAAWRSRNHVGRKAMVVFFYLGDFMPASITQAKAYQKSMARFKAANVAVVGISGDKPANHLLFKKKYGLNFTLLSDGDSQVARFFGVPRSGGGTYRFKDSNGKQIALQRTSTPARWTFVFDKAGRVIYKKVVSKPGEEVREILPLVEKLQRRR